LFGEAEQKAARLAFKQGRAAFEQGRYAEALDRFEHAYALSQRSELLFNIGLAADRIRHDERALEAFEEYLKDAPDSAHREQVQMRVIALREAMARHKVSEPVQKSAAPTPAEVAAASVSDEERSPLSPAPSRAVDDDGSVLESFWFWAGVTVVLVGGGVTAFVLLQPEEQAELPRPNTDLTVQTLRLAP
jgi:tetratricopeptide (TPR) repeat protein